MFWDAQTNIGVSIVSGQCLNCIFEGNVLGKVLYVCANYFTSDCLTNEGQFNAGFSQGLILKEGSIPTLVAQTSAPDEVSITRHMLFFKLLF